MTLRSATVSREAPNIAGLSMQGPGPLKSGGAGEQSTFTLRAASQKRGKRKNVYWTSVIYPVSNSSWSKFHLLLWEKWVKETWEARSFTLGDFFKKERVLRICVTRHSSDHTMSRHKTKFCWFTSEVWNPYLL